MILAGIDEAGYGPLLGPLCVGMVVLRIEPSASLPLTPGGLPDLWAMLGPSVVPTPAQAGPTAVAVADSKRLKLANSTKTRHPLIHLERGVLAMAQHAIGEPADDLALLDAVSAPPPSDRAWWSGPGVGLPLSGTVEQMTLLRAHVRGACERCGVRVVEARCAALDAPEFNALLRQHAAAAVPAGRAGWRPSGADDAEGEGGDAGGSKARVLFAQVARHLRRIWLSREAALAGADPSLDPPRVVIDRQGGRTDYLRVLAEAFPDAAVRRLGVSRAASAYEIVGEGDPVRRVRVLFRTEAESYAMPVALASMLAKLVRELWMQRFNAYWCARLPGLRPTAGYVADGRRWLEDAAPLLDGQTRALLCRQR
jgi:hypothetical protein